MQTSNSPDHNALHGSLAGLMLGDTLGLPYEGLSARRVNKWLKAPLQQRLVGRFGMVSDDTEHAALTALALLTSQHNSELFGHALARALRAWFIRLPAGVGMATARACIRLCLGFSYKHSGVFSAGNGPAMRAPILGVMYADKPDQLKAYVKISTQITHTDPKATIAALAIALAAALSARQIHASMDLFIQHFHELLHNESTLQGEALNEFLRLLQQVKEGLAQHQSPQQMAAALGLSKGITGYCYHTVPMVIFMWLSTGEFEQKITALIRLGGDTDTTAAILGGILGARGFDTLPQAMLDCIYDYPFNPKLIAVIATQLAQLKQSTTLHDQPMPKTYLFLGWPRNLVFLGIVLLHGLRRLLPPY